MIKKGYCHFYKNIYWGESVKKHSLVKWRLYHGSGQFTIFVLKRAASESDQLEIMHCAFLKQPYYLKNPAYIYGIASSYDEAVDLVVRITNEAVASGYEGRLLDYLEAFAG